MKMIESRTMTSHTYNEEIADEIAKAVLEEYFLLFSDLFQTMENLLQKEE